LPNCAPCRRRKSARTFAECKPESSLMAGWFRKTNRSVTRRAYYFTHVPPGSGERGATHTAELAYMFNNPPANRSWTEADQKLADTVQFGPQIDAPRLGLL
jgi:hypothetical protein